MYSYSIIAASAMYAIFQQFLYRILPFMHTSQQPNKSTSKHLAPPLPPHPQRQYSVNKLPPSYIPNGNTSQHKRQNHVLMKTQNNWQVFNRMPQGGSSKNGVIGDGKEKEKNMVAGGSRNSQERKQNTWGSTWTPINRGSKENQIPVDDIPSDQPAAREPRVLMKYPRSNYFHKNERNISNEASRANFKPIQYTPKKQEQPRGTGKGLEVFKNKQKSTSTLKHERPDINIRTPKKEDKPDSSHNKENKNSQEVPRPSYNPRQPVGLNNIGNTCYMNATLQCMLNLPIFNESIIKCTQKQSDRHSKVAPAYFKLLTTMRSTAKKAQNPAQLKMAVASKKHRFSGYSQQDAQQFLTGLLQLMNIDLNRSKAPKYQELTADLNKNTLQEISDTWWNYNKSRQNSVICDYFTGQLLSRVVCGKCRQQSIAFDHTWQYALPLSSSPSTLTNLLHSFLQEETIPHDYYCSHCKDFHECKRKVDFYRLPQILVLHLKRFHYGKYSKRKLNTKVSISHQIDLAPFLTNKTHKVNETRYELVGMVHHSGDIDFGHYTADCVSQTGQWFNYNDSSVSRTTLEEPFNSNTPYLLFYSRKNN